MSFFRFSFWANESSLVFFVPVFLIEMVFFAEDLLGELVVSKGELLAEMTFSLSW